MESVRLIAAYLTSGSVSDKVEYSNDTLLRALLLSDFLQLEELQTLIVVEKITPSLSFKNSLLYLKEAFNKLQTSKDILDGWRLLFNQALDIAAQGILWLLTNKAEELKICDQTLIDQIVDRSLRHDSTWLSEGMCPQLRFLMQIRQRTDVTELIRDRRDALQHRKTERNTICITSLMFLPWNSHQAPQASR